LGKDAFLREYRNFPHGIWSFDVSFGGIKDSKFAVEQTIIWIKELIHMNEDRLNVD
jgi:hypothetical protein